MTVYQADWALAAITFRSAAGPLLELPLRQLAELGEQVWGSGPTHLRPDGSEPVTSHSANEQGPIEGVWS